MELPNKAVQEFKEIYKRKFGVELSDGQAKIKADNFLSLTYLLAGGKSYNPDKK